MSAALLESGAAVAALSMRGCGLGAGGVARLSRPLAGLATLQRLDLSHNALTGGHTWSTLAASLCELRSLETLSLNGNVVTSKEVRRRTSRRRMCLRARCVPSHSA